MPESAVLTDPLLKTLPVIEGFKVLSGIALFQKLGQGGMGAVYRGRHVRLDLDVAVKVMTPPLGASQSASDAFIKRFIREARVAALISHPNIIRTIDVNSESGLFYLCMDFVDGESAAARLRRKGPLPEVEVLGIGYWTAQGLGAAHKRGFIHRDVKPDNIMIGKDGRVYVADLGLAKAIEKSGETSSDLSMTGTQSAIGTPMYMPPEQFLSARSAKPQADVWAVGVCMYRLLTGRLPWRDSNVFALGRKIADDPLPDPRLFRPDISDGLVNIIWRCCSKDPAQRYPDGRELAQALRVQAGNRQFNTTLLADPSLENEASVAVEPPEESLLVIASHLDSFNPVSVDDEAETLALPSGASQRPTQAADDSDEQRTRSRHVPLLVALAALLIGALLVTAFVRNGESTSVAQHSKVESLLDAALVLRRSGSLEEARQKLNDAISLKPSHTRAAQLLSEVKQEIQQRDAARERARQYQRWCDQALTLKLNGKLKEAAEAYDQAQEYAPAGDEKARQAAARCRHDLLVAEARRAEASDLSEAIDLYRKALEHSDVEQTHQALQRARDLAAEQRRTAAITALRAEAAQAAARREWSEAAALLEQAAQMGAAVGDELARLQSTAQSFELLRQAGADITAERWPAAMGKLRQVLAHSSAEPSLVEALRERLGTLVPQYSAWPFDTAEARRRQQETARRLNIPVTDELRLGGGVIMKLVLVPAGEFVMGMTGQDSGPPHRVRLTRPFYLGAHEVTQKQWTTLMAHNPSRNKGDRRPVEQVAWHAAAEFAQALARKTSRACRLPTEAEWEYACRAGSENGFAGGREEDLAEHAWYFRNSKRCTHEVGTRRTNAWGLCDMHGNVAEFCQDWFAPYRAGLAVDPSGPPQGSSKVVRGGAFSLPAEWLDGRLRITVPPDAGKDTVGLRIAVDAVPNL